MKLLGDVPPEKQELAYKLTETERQINEKAGIPLDRKAQMYVCLAHDWYQVDMEEEGNRLLAKAESVYPGYFRDVMIKHTVESKDFDKLVKNLSIELVWMLVSRLDERTK